MSPQAEQHMRLVIDEYLDAVGKAFGEAYRDAITVEANNTHVMIRHPDATRGEMIPLSYMPILTRNTRNGWFRKNSA